MLKETIVYLEEIMETESYDLTDAEKEILFHQFKDKLNDKYMNHLYLDIYCNSKLDSITGEENLYIKSMKKEISNKVN